MNGNIFNTAISIRLETSGNLTIEGTCWKIELKEKKISHCITTWKGNWKNVFNVPAEIS